jgi:hypothetical protein
MKGFKVLSTREWLVSHLFIFVGLILMSCWLYGFQPTGINMLVFGIWFLVGGFCWVAAYALPKLILYNK